VHEVYLFVPVNDDTIWSVDDLLDRGTEAFEVNEAEKIDSKLFNGEFLD